MKKQLLTSVALAAIFLSVLHGVPGATELTPAQIVKRDFDALRPVKPPAKRAYLMRGLLELSPGLSDIGEQLRRRGWTVTVGSWMQQWFFTQDALQHPHARVVFIGHSMGAQEAFVAGGVLKRYRRNVQVVGLDPLCTNPPMTPGLNATNIWGNMCFAARGEVRGAKNVLIPGYSHIGYCTDPRVQKHVLSVVN